MSCISEAIGIRAIRHALERHWGLNFRLTDSSWWPRSRWRLIQGGLLYAINYNMENNSDMTHSAYMPRPNCRLTPAWLTAPAFWKLTQMWWIVPVMPLIALYWENISLFNNVLISKMMYILYCIRTGITWRLTLAWLNLYVIIVTFFQLWISS